MIRLAHVQRRKVVSIDNTTIVIAERRESLDPLGHAVRVGGAQRDMMHAARAIARPREIVADDDVHLRVRASIANLVYMNTKARLAGEHVDVVGFEPEPFGEKTMRRIEVGNRDDRVSEPADLMLGRDGTGGPRKCR